MVKEGMDQQTRLLHMYKTTVPNTVKHHALYTSCRWKGQTEGKARTQHLGIVGTLVAQRNHGAHLVATRDLEYFTQPVLLVAVHDEVGNALRVRQKANRLDQERRLLVRPRLHGDAVGGGLEPPQHAVNHVQHPAEEHVAQRVAVVLQIR